MKGLKGFLKDNKDVFYFLLAMGIGFIFYIIPFPDELTVGENQIVLTHQGRITMALLLFAIVLWVTEAIPFAVTSLLVMLLMPLFGATEGLKVMREEGMVEIFGAAQGLKEMIRMSFGNRLILFFMGVFLLSGAFIKSGLGERLTQWLLLLVGNRTKLVILGFLTMGALLSMWITDMAVAALMVPLGVSILKSAGISPIYSKGIDSTDTVKAAGEDPRVLSNFGKALMISCCWGAAFGGIGTPAGCGPNPIAIEYLKDLAGIEVSFLDWMKLGVPLALALVPVGWLFLITIFPPEMKRLPLTREDIKGKLIEKGPISKDELVTLVVFLSVIILWVGGDFIGELTGGRLILSMEMVALMGGLVFFLPGIRVMTWDEAEPLMNWGAIVLVMASLALGLMMFKTGAARWISFLLLGKITLFPSLIQVALVITAVLVMKLFLASNTVTGIIIIPLIIILAVELNIDAWFLVAPAAFTASLGIILLTQSPTNIIPYTSGYFTVRDFALSGILFTIIMVGLLTSVIAVIGPITGIYTF